jgi:CO/xanthine dehydrogenase FAD-binding subunit
MSYARPQQVYTPQDLSAALTFLAEHRHEGWQPLAGGTDVMVGLYRDRRGGDRWLNLARLRRELAEIRWLAEPTGRIAVGALTTMAELYRSPLIQHACPLLAEAASHVGAVQVQQRATVGGNIANGSPAADTLPAWLALDAQFELMSVRGRRTIACDQFATGYRRNLLEPDELLTGITFAPRLGRRQWGYFRKVAPRLAQGISKVVFTGLIDIETGRCQHVRLAWGSLGPTVLRTRQAEQATEGRLAPSEASAEPAPPDTSDGSSDSHPVSLLRTELHPIDDARSTAAYRHQVACNLLREFLAGHLGSLHLPELRAS